MADQPPACPRCAAAEAARDANLARALSAEAHANHLVNVVAANTQKLAANTQKLAALQQELRASAQRTHDLLQHFIDRLSERLRDAFSASTEQVTEFRDLLDRMKFTAGTTHPDGAAHTVILAKTRQLEYTKFQLHSGTERYIAGITRSYSNRGADVHRYGRQGNGTNLRKFIRSRVEPQLEVLLRDEIATRERRPSPDSMAPFTCEWRSGTRVTEDEIEALLNEAAGDYYAQGAADPEALFEQHKRSVGDVCDEVRALVELIFPLHHQLLPP